jgi:hypothetical protein
MSNRDKQDYKLGQNVANRRTRAGKGARAKISALRDRDSRAEHDEGLMAINPRGWRDVDGGARTTAEWAFAGTSYAAGGGK